MKNTCVVRVGDNCAAHFWPSQEGYAYIPYWPRLLNKKFPVAGIYSIRSVKKSSPRSVRVVITKVDREDVESDVTARFYPEDYGICSRFLDELGVTPPPEGKQKTLHLVVTKRKAKK